ncbi:MAG: lasso peptide biosynthesis B2 protein [Pseudomonadota bacterium]
MISRTLRRGEVLAALAAAYVLVFVFPFRMIARWLGAAAPLPAPAPVDGLCEVDPGMGHPERCFEGCRRLARTVERAARRSPVPLTCLVQALALWILLHRRGILGTIRLGVRPGKAGPEAHAWLSVADRIILGGRGTHAFTPIADLGGGRILSPLSDPSGPGRGGHRPPCP